MGGYRTLAVALLVFALGGCGDGVPPMTVRDGSTRRDAVVIRPDAGPPPDAGFDAGRRRDAGFDAAPPPDAGGRDTGPGFDTGPGDGGAFPDLCGPVGGTPCAGCSTGEICLDNGCGDDRCVPSGNPCADEQHCHASSSCVSGVCRAGTPGVTCNDSRDCPTGFSCDSNSCVDRRIACSADDRFPCPQGFVCYEDGVTHPFCRRMHLPCTPLGGDVGGVSAGCLDDGQCGDVSVGAGNVCYTSSPVGSCALRTSCTFLLGGVCGVNPLVGENRCGRFGLCRPGMSDCGSAFVCVDLWGDGAAECVPALGACDEASDCAAGSVCAAPWYWGPPRCIPSPVPFD